VDDITAALQENDRPDEGPRNIAQDMILPQFVQHGVEGCHPGECDEERGGNTNVAKSFLHFPARMAKYFGRRIKNLASLQKMHC
jgi:hypothetical protein